MFIWKFGIDGYPTWFAMQSWKPPEVAGAKVFVVASGLPWMLSMTIGT